MLQYIKLARLHQPTGFLLLFWPCSFGLAAADKAINFKLNILFLLASIVMRAAGCVVNDIIDKNLDAQVARTKMRPIACGSISTAQSLIFLSALLLTGATFLFSLNRISILIGLLSMILVVIYPFMKRVINYPQAVLGLTFNTGALIGYASVTNSISKTSILLYVACFFWTLGYDTIYGYQDYRDDQQLGINSTSLTFLKTNKIFLYGCYLAMILTLFLLGKTNGYAVMFYILLSFVLLILMWQVLSLNVDCPRNCLQRFKANGYLGLIILLGFIFR